MKKLTRVCMFFAGLWVFNLLLFIVSRANSYWDKFTDGEMIIKILLWDLCGGLFILCIWLIAIAFGAGEGE